jgi:hypothetical protein
MIRVLVVTLGISSGSASPEQCTSRASVSGVGILHFKNASPAPVWEEKHCLRAPSWEVALAPGCLLAQKRMPAPGCSEVTLKCPLPGATVLCSEPRLWPLVAKSPRGG